eukprot:7160477-Karenia_brevis.AAC.1
MAMWTCSEWPSHDWHFLGWMWAFLPICWGGGKLISLGLFAELEVHVHQPALCLNLVLAHVGTLSLAMVEAWFALFCSVRARAQR